MIRGEFESNAYLLPSSSCFFLSSLFDFCFCCLICVSVVDCCRLTYLLSSVLVPVEKEKCEFGDHVIRTCWLCQDGEGDSGETGVMLLLRVLVCLCLCISCDHTQTPLWVEQV